ncbi:MAG: hypothetical protein UMS36scaffold28_67 [Phage 59_13]|nr:MAG: hypothetical protein UMS36scaffold28_67 [Phage 59_13]
MTKFERAWLPEIQEWKLKEMARVANVAVQKLTSIIKEERGRTIGTFLNDLYQVNIMRWPMPPGYPKMLHLSVKRRDKQPIHDWRHLQQIKNELVGPEYEGVELYPAESRRADSANQYHLFVVDDPGKRFPLGYRDRFVQGESIGGAVQRPFDD